VSLPPRDLPRIFGRSELVVIAEYPVFHPKLFRSPGLNTLGSIGTTVTTPLPDPKADDWARAGLSKHTQAHMIANVEITLIIRLITLHDTK
jgi:hypothetical protein